MAFKFSLELNTGRFLARILLGNDAANLIWIHQNSRKRDFRRKPSHSYSGIRPIERTLSVVILERN